MYYNKYMFEEVHQSHRETMQVFGTAPFSGAADN